MYVHVTLTCVCVTTVAVEKSITHCKYVFVALGIQHATRMRHIIFYDLPGSKICFHIISTNGTIKKCVTEHKMCFDFLYNFCPKHFSF